MGGFSARKLVLQISATLTPWSKHQSDTSLRHENAAWQEPRPRMAQLKDKVEPSTPLLHHTIHEVTPTRIQALETRLNNLCLAVTCVVCPDQSGRSR